MYSSKYGTTEKVAKMVVERITPDNDVTLIPLSGTLKKDLSIYEKIILDTSIYAGQPMKLMNQFCENNESILRNKVIGLFVCGMQVENDESELKEAYPDYLHKIAKVEAFMGGELLLNEMNFFVRWMMKRMMKTQTSIYKINIAAVDNFSAAMK